MKKIFFYIIISLFIIACSPIDSVRPFDQEQAALLLKNQPSQKKS